MIEGAFAPLWAAYKSSWQGPDGADPGTKKTSLRAFLIRYAGVADGGFVGARDRSVAQVLAESRLFRAARSHVQALPAADRCWRDARELGERMACWAREHGFAWVADPAPALALAQGVDFGLGLTCSRCRPGWWCRCWRRAGASSMPSAGPRCWPPMALHGLGAALPREPPTAALLASITISAGAAALLGALLTGGGIVAMGVLFFIYSAVAVWILASGTYKAFLGAASLLWPTCSRTRACWACSACWPLRHRRPSAMVPVLSASCARRPFSRGSGGPAHAPGAVRGLALQR